MATGTVKWFNNAKGYGFILPEDGSADLFAHYSSIQMEGYRTLKAGQTVTFDEVEGPKGGHAANIRALETSSDQAQDHTPEQTRENKEAIQESSQQESSQPEKGSAATAGEVTPSSKPTSKEAADSLSLMTSDASQPEELAEPH